MIWLIMASIIWGFSFGVTKGLSINLDSFLLNFYRVGVATLFFTPWFLNKFPTIYMSASNAPQKRGDQSVHIIKIFQAFICGAIQIGLMYGPYTLSFRYLKAHEVALFTMTTPLIMSGILVGFQLMTFGSRSSNEVMRLATASFLATCGGIIVANGDLSSEKLAVGAGLVQLSNLFFAIGSILWTRWFAHEQKHLFMMMTPFFLGALFSCLIQMMFFANSIDLPSLHQWLALFWLGGISSGVGFYFWNKGATLVNEATLSVTNNIKLPIAILISILIFGEEGNAPTLTLGIILIMLSLHLGTSLPKPRPQH